MVLTAICNGHIIEARRYGMGTKGRKNVKKPKKQKVEKQKEQVVKKK
jgi:hypothetical protein